MSESTSTTPWAEVQLTEEQAIKMAQSKVYESWSAKEVMRFQMFQKRLCMDFSYFHKCCEEVLGRPVFTHEFAYRDKMIAEFNGDAPAPTLEEIINLIPADKRIIIGL